MNNLGGPVSGLRVIELAGIGPGHTPQWSLPVSALMSCESNAPSHPLRLTGRRTNCCEVDDDQSLS
jgi:hypothetical protein